MNYEKLKIRKIIESAFDDVARPSTSLQQFLLTDEKGMSGTITEEEWRLAGITRIDTKWQDIPELEIEHCDCQLAHMQAEDFRYYIPAYMLYSLDHAQDDIVDCMIPGSVIFGLTPSKDYPSYSFSQYSLLDSSQRAAVAAFLTYMADHAEEYSSRDARSALPYWTAGV